MGIQQLLRQRREARDRKFATEEQRVAALNDVPTWYTDYCNMRVTPPPRLFNAKGSPNAWLDSTLYSACMRRIDYWRNSWEVQRKTGKFIFMRLEPRDSGKSASFECEVLRLFAEDRNMTVGYGAQNKTKAADRAKWFKGRFISSNLCQTFGDFKARGYDWSNERVTVSRPMGPGENPSLFIFSPGVSFTGAHPRLWALDDLVDARNSKSVLKAMQVMVTWNDIIQTCGTETMIWIIGTWWPGVRHLYDEIADKYKEFADIEIVPAFGEAHDIYGTRTFSNKGHQNYPWITQKFLERQKQFLPDHEYLGAYENVRAWSGTHFRLKNFIQADPRKLNGDILTPKNLDRRHYNMYIVTDPADNEGETRGLSKGAMAVVAVAGTGERYVLDMHLDYYLSPKFVDLFVELYRKWMPLDGYAMEINGPGKTYPGWLRERIEHEGLPPLTHREIHLVGLGTKPSRLMTLFQPMSQKKLIFAHSVHPNIIDWDPQTKVPVGLIPAEAAKFNPNGFKDTLDGLDCLCMAFLTDRDGPICPTPSVFEIKPEESPQAFHEKRMKEGIAHVLEGRSKGAYRY